MFDYDSLNRTNPKCGFNYQVEGLGPLPSTNDVVSPLDTRRAVLGHGHGGIQRESHPRNLPRDTTPSPADDAEYCSASAADRAVVF
jgi:hypothetical protein